MYEEKTFENYFNAELDRKSKIYFPPGQVQEGSLGFDSSSFSRNRSFWRRLGHPFWISPKFAGIDLREIADEMERFLQRTINDIPNIKTNLLIQYKRSVFIQQANGKEWRHWNEPYFRYDVDQSQQILLAHLHKKFGNKALVIYAAPTATSMTDLVNLKKKNKIIDSTNFCKSVSLTGHRRNTFTRAGLHSIACSDPVQIERFDLVAELEKIPNNSGIESTKFIYEFSQQVREICLDNQSVSLAFKLLLEESDMSYLNEKPLLFALRSMQIFREITGIQWLLVTAAE
jgi:hypothetical protein